MPELPEVETMCRGLLPTVGSSITGLLRPTSNLRPIGIAPPLNQFRRRVLGRELTAIERLGKRVVLRLDSEDRIVFEPRMTGRVLVSESVSTEYIRLVIALSGGPISRVVFRDVRGLGLVHLLSPSQFGKRLGPDVIGPDALQVTAEELCQRLGSSRRPIKVALLDQQVVAGIGNLYASEILHDASIHPELPCHQFSPGQWQRLHASIHQILEEAIRCQGSTLSDGTYRTPIDQAGGYQAHHRVYQRAGQFCLRCGDQPILRIVQVQRSTFFCPGCQLR